MSKDEVRTVHEAVRETEYGLAVWSVPRLWDLAKDLPVEWRDMSEHPALGSHAWGQNLTVGEIIDHFSRIQQANTTYPILMAADGRIFDGLHRIVKNLLNYGPIMRVQQFKIDPKPDRYDPIPGKAALCRQCPHGAHVGVRCEGTIQLEHGVIGCQCWVER